MDSAKRNNGAEEVQNALKSAVTSHAAELRQEFRAAIGPQTLIQPDLPVNATVAALVVLGVVGAYHDLVAEEARRLGARMSNQGFLLGER